MEVYIMLPWDEINALIVFTSFLIHFISSKHKQSESVLSEVAGHQQAGDNKLQCAIMFFVVLFLLHIQIMEHNLITQMQRVEVFNATV